MEIPLQCFLPLLSRQHEFHRVASACTRVLAKMRSPGARVQCLCVPSFLVLAASGTTGRSSLPHSFSLFLHFSFPADSPPLSALRFCSPSFPPNRYMSVYVYVHCRRHCLNCTLLLSHPAAVAVGKTATFFGPPQLSVRAPNYIKSNFDPLSLSLISGFPNMQLYR